jgi:exodeoxyribonuclease VII large subunit
MDGAYTVRELCEAVQLALGTWFPGEIWVEGEVADLSRSGPGHVYFTLGDPDTSPNGDAVRLQVTLLDSARQHVNAVLKRAGGAVRINDGTRLRIRGRLELYPSRGRLQLRMSGIDPTYTLGLLSTERERVLRSLADEGLVERNRELPFPAMPLRIGVVTSHASAAMADFVDELVRSGFAWDVVVADTRVQGATADQTIVRSMRALVERDVQVLVLIRGGGARTDLATFDSELIARTIAAMPIPVVTGIGHEIDASVADEIAHRSHKTPTACAAALVADVAAGMDRVESAWSSIAAVAASGCRDRGQHLRARSVALARSARRQLDLDSHALAARRHRVGREATNAAARSRLLLARQVGRAEGAARRHLSVERSRIDRAAPDLASRSRRSLRRLSDDLSAAAERIGTLDPASLMERGWSLTRTAQGTVLRRVAGVETGEEIVTCLADGEIRSRVTQVDRRTRPAEVEREG